MRNTFDTDMAHARNAARCAMNKTPLGCKTREEAERCVVPEPLPIVLNDDGWRELRDRLRQGNEDRIEAQTFRRGIK